MIPCTQWLEPANIIYKPIIKTGENSRSVVPEVSKKLEAKTSNQIRLLRRVSDVAAERRLPANPTRSSVRRRLTGHSTTHRFGRRQTVGAVEKSRSLGVNNLLDLRYRRGHRTASLRLVSLQRRMMHLSPLN